MQGSSHGESCASLGKPNATRPCTPTLHNHAAGEQHAGEMLRALRDRHADTSVNDFAADLLHQVEEDLTRLEGLATDIGAGGFQAKEWAGWLADKLSRLKLSPLDKPFHIFEALEFLSLGILGKRAVGDLSISR